MALQPTIIEALNSQKPRVDLIKSDFDTLIVQKGRRVSLETALVCPCKSISSGNLSNCKNCGGCGWIFINPKETRMVVQSIDAVQKYTGWSEELTGMTTISALYNEQLTFMDRITLLDGETIHNEVLVPIQLNSGSWFARTSYRVKEVLYLAKYISFNAPLVRLQSGVDYTINESFITFLNIPVTQEENTLSITIRYKHMPVYNIKELKRDTMQSFKLDNGIEQNQLLPLSAYAVRQHNIPDLKKFSNNDMVNNSYSVNYCN